MNTEKFISKAIAIHGNVYSYDHTEYTKSRIKVKIYCKSCSKYFYVTPNNHLSKRTGCANCGTKRMKNAQCLGSDTFIAKSREIHGIAYGYEEVKYVNTKTPVRIYCKKCTTYFLQCPGTHLRGSGCPTCGHYKTSKKQAWSREKFIEKSTKIFGDDIGYDLVEYKTMYHKVKLLCKKCDRFFYKLPVNHIHNMQGCPFCRMSKGETIIRQILDRHGIAGIREYRMRCTDGDRTRVLRADYYLSKYNAIIEFDGLQHFRETNFFDSDTLVYVRDRDALKNSYCIDNGISLLRIHYKDINRTEALVLSFLERIDKLKESFGLVMFSRTSYE